MGKHAASSQASNVTSDSVEGVQWVPGFLEMTPSKTSVNLLGGCAPISHAET